MTWQTPKVSTRRLIGFRGNRVDFGYPVGRKDWHPLEARRDEFGAFGGTQGYNFSEIARNVGFKYVPPAELTSYSEEEALDMLVDFIGHKYGKKSMTVWVGFDKETVSKKYGPAYEIQVPDNAVMLLDDNDGGKLYLVPSNKPRRRPVV